MRRFLIAAWLLLPVAAWAYHEGPGQDGLQLDQVDEALAEASAASESGDWAAAVERYDEALQAMPELSTPALRRAAWRIRLSAAKAKLTGSELIEARTDLADLVEELSSDDEADPRMVDEAREAHANAQYYYTWLMRLEGYPREEWEPEVEVARQTYRLLAERARDRGAESDAKVHMEDLESTIKLARIDLEELQGLPLPSQ
ncbi:MAG: hypothetical protein AAF726_04885 [Planctomycetota bacterium]